MMFNRPLRCMVGDGWMTSLLLGWAEPSRVEPAGRVGTCVRNRFDAL